jgi:hypothetical protein
MEIEPEKKFNIVCNYGVTYSLDKEDIVLSVLREYKKYKLLLEDKKMDLSGTADTLAIVRAGPKGMIALISCTETSEPKEETNQCCYSFTQEDIEGFTELASEAMDYLREIYKRLAKHKDTGELSLGWCVTIEYK